MQITYRNYYESDVEGIIRFWNENSGWETDLDLKKFNVRFCSSHVAKPIIMLAIDDDINEIVGLCSFIPLGVTINHVDKKCYRPLGAIFKESFRQKFGLTSFLTGKHPIIQLCYHGAEKAKESDAALIYLIPDPRWGKILSVMPCETRQFPLWSYNLAIAKPFELGSEISIGKIDPSDPGIDLLWQQSPKTDLCTLTKDAPFYHLKVCASQGRYKLWGVRSGNQLIGVFTLDKKEGSRQWLICDLLASDHHEILLIIIKAACNTIHGEFLQLNNKSDQPYKAAILATQLIEQKVKTLGFFKDNYNFVFAVHRLNGEFTKKEVAPERWYISAND